jgi:hypothetical protein
MGDRCRHGLELCSRCTQVTDAARRMAEGIGVRIVFTPWDLLVRSCMAFRLDDGSTDGVLYPDRKTALSYQLRPCCVFYFRNSPGGVDAFDCQIFLNINRLAYENDRITWVDPESPDFIISDRSAQIMRGKVSPLN